MISNPSAVRTAFLSTLAMLAFAANSLLCRLALADGHIDAASFAGVRLFTGAAALALLLRLRGARSAGSWRAGLALALYAVPFSLAYVALTAGTGALILFAAVQLTMVGVALSAGERPHRLEWIGLMAALVGLGVLVAPGLERPPPAAAAAMALAGVAWGVYSLSGRGSSHPVAETAGNFARSLPFAAATFAGAAVLQGVHLGPRGVALATVSGALTSGIGYVLWYAALAGLTATRAALVQLAAPALAAGGGVLFLDEALTARLLVAATLILGGLWLAGQAPRPAAPAPGPSRPRRRAPREHPRQAATP
jgi:drug/metabolite transporter (DMT)-like permease